MVVKAVAADSGRYDAMDTTANVTSIGGGAGASVDPDINYQGGNAISRKVAAGSGFYSSTGAGRDMTATARRTWLVKTWLTNYGSLATSGNSHVVRIGSGTGAYYEYIIGSPARAYPAKGGFVIDAIDPGIAAHRDATTGSPTLTACNYFATYAVCSTSKVENLALDAIDVGLGLYITGGTSTDPDGIFADFAIDDEDDVTNGRFGYMQRAGNALLVFGRLVIGATSSSGSRTPTATEFTDSNAVVRWLENRAAAGFSGLTVDLGNASTVVTWSGCSFGSDGTVAGEDTRAVLDVFGTSGTLAVHGCTFDAFANLNLTAGATFDEKTRLVNCDALALNGGVLDDCLISDHTTATNEYFIDTNDLELISNCAFDNTGGTGHAIRITATGTYNFDANFFTGYGADGTGNAAIFNDSGGAVTINVINGGSTPTYRNGTGASTTVNNNKTFVVSNLDAGSLVVFVRESDGTELYAATESSGVVTYAYNYTVDTPIFIQVIDLNTEVQIYDGYSLLSTNQSIVHSPADDAVYSNPT